MQEFDYSESDIARYCGVSIRHAQREIPKLEKLGLLVMTRQSGKSKMYRLNKSGKAGIFLEKFDFALAKAETPIVEELLQVS